MSIVTLHHLLLTAFFAICVLVTTLVVDQRGTHTE